MHSWQTDTLRTAIEGLHGLADLLQVRPMSGHLLADEVERAMTREQQVECVQDLDPGEERERVAACLLIIDQILGARLRQNEERCAGKR